MAHYKKVVLTNDAASVRFLQDPGRIFPKTIKLGVKKLNLMCYHKYFIYVSMDIC